MLSKMMWTWQGHVEKEAVLSKIISLRKGE